MTVAFDFGAIYKGYCSDFGRSVFIGEPHPEALAAYEAITSGNLATMPVMRDGQITPTGVANFMRDHVAARGFGKHYMYEGLGHAIGLGLKALVAASYDKPIASDMCFTLERRSGTLAPITCGARTWWSWARRAHGH